MNGWSQSYQIRDFHGKNGIASANTNRIIAKI
jgi:hypothetical protein